MGLFLLEDGNHLLLEDGNHLLLEDGGSAPAPPPVVSGRLSGRLTPSSSLRGQLLSDS